MLGFVSDEIPVGSPPAPPGRHAAPGGWYADPVDHSRERYWDGWQWTRNVRARVGARPTDRGGRPGPGSYGSGPYRGAGDHDRWEPGGPGPGQSQAPGPYAEPGSYGSEGRGAPGTYGAAPGQWQGYAPAGPGYQMVPATADGVPLAAWGWRALALIIDLLLVLVMVDIIARVTGLSARMDQASNAYAAYVQEVLTTGTQFDLAYAIGLLSTPATIIVNLLNVALFVIYSAVMLSRRGATLGKIVCRLRVVPVGQGHGGPALPAKKAWLRPLVTQAFGLVPLLGLVDYLFPLWDKKKQTLHDKIVTTQVIRER